MRRDSRPLSAQLPPFPCGSRRPISGPSALKTTARACVSAIGWKAAVDDRINLAADLHFFGIGMSMGTLLALASFGWMAAETATERYAPIFQTVRNFEVAETDALADEYVSTDATLEFPGVPRSDPTRKRLWRNVASSGVRCDTRVLRMTIVAVQKLDATVDAKAACKVQYPSRNGIEFSGVTSWISDRLQLRRVGGAGK